MSTYTITKKHQVTVDPKVMSFLDLKAGDKITYFIEKNGSVKLVNPKQLIRANRGMVKTPKRFAGKGLDEIIEVSKKEYFKNNFSKKQNQNEKQEN